MKRLAYQMITSPVGKLTVVVTSEALVAVLWENENFGRVPLGAMELSRGHPLLIRAERQLKEYFKGERPSFELPLLPSGTAFQKKVWKALLRIPFGETRSYGEIAKRVGSPHAARAVGAAIGRNPVSIIVPCHRVIGANGRLTGFAGGLRAKEFLLIHENNRFKH